MNTSQIVTDDISEVLARYNPGSNISKNVMTKYEKTKILGVRMEQIVRGAPPLVSFKEGDSVRDIVTKELAERCLPFIVVRTLPNNVKEIYKLEDMIIT